MGKFSILLFFAALSVTFWSTVKPDPIDEKTFTSLKRTMEIIEERLLTVEKQQKEEQKCQKKRYKREEVRGSEFVSKRMAEIEEKNLKLQRENKALFILFRRMNTEIEILQMKENLTRVLISSHMAAQKKADEAILQNMAFKTQPVDGRLLRLENGEKAMKNNIRNLADLISKLENEAPKIERKLLNHSSEISRINTELIDIITPCTDDPPSLRNGKAMDFERRHGSRVAYECKKSFVMTGNSSVRCGFGQWEGDPPACSYFDTTFYAERYERYSSLYIECHSDNYAGKIQFSRVVDTGSGGGVPRNSTISTSEKSAKMDFSGEGWISLDSLLGRDRLGAFRCGFEAEEGSTYAIVPNQDAYLYFHDVVFPGVASVGDNVTLSLFSYDTSKRVFWSHDGRNLTSLEGKTDIFDVLNANSGHEGIYSARYKSDTYDRAVVHLSVRRCKANVFGERCDQVCPSCYNGGICHDMLGICVCPEGFVGRNCETPCPEGFHGADCTIACRYRDCKWRLFCKPSPYGCHCASGFKGVWCHDECDQGWYGSHCKQPCHCAEGSVCNRFTGACSGGCARGWKGLSCQIRDAD